MGFWDLFTRKIKATAFDVGITLLRFVPASEDDFDGYFPNGFPEGFTDFDRQKVENEIIYFNIFTVVFALSNALGNSSVQRDNILDVFYAHCKEKKFIPSDPKDLGIFLSRIYKYTEAVETPHHNGPAWTVGCAFSEACGWGRRGREVITASILFSATHMAVLDFVKSVKIIES